MAKLRDIVESHLSLAIRLAKFAAVGSSGVAVNTLSLYLLHERVSLPLLLAQPLAVEVSIASNFLLNNRWTFEKSSIALTDFAKFNLISVGSLVVVVASTQLLIAVASVYYLLANLVGIALATALNFCLNLLWTWRQV